MHQPRPHGQFGDLIDGADATVAAALMRSVTNIKQVSGIESLRMTRQLPGGGYAMAMDMGGIVKLVISNPVVDDPRPDLDGQVTTYVPMLFSGVVTKSMLYPGEKVQIRITRQTQKRLQGYKEPWMTNGRQEYDHGEYQSLERFRIPYGQRFAEFEPKGGVLEHTRYTQLLPTWYSGAMAQVVQIVGGYGKREFSTKPKNPVETMALRMPADVLAAVEREISDKKLPGFTGLPPQNGEIRYDYKFYECHGVAFDTGKKPWLLRVDRRGVYAMPLPMVPATTTKAFKKWVDKVGDDELAWVIDRFGGLPSGETFPLGGAFDAWERAGVITKVCDTQDFYRYSAYSTACGWSFNSRGTEAYNTCWDYDEEKGWAYGMTYAMRLKLGEVRDDDDAPPELDDDQQRRLNDYMSALYRESAKDRENGPALRYKLGKAKVQELLQRAELAPNDMSGEYTYWDNHKAEPIATHNGSVARVGKGWLYHPAKPNFQPSIKFPEPLFQACLSFDFRPLINGRFKTPPKCDTVMYAYFVGDQLKTIKYFYDETQKSKPSEDNYEACMIVGSWEKTDYGGKVGLHGNFYSTDKDDRKTFGLTETRTKTVGKDMGYDSTPYFSFEAPFLMDGLLWRNRYFTHDTTVETDDSPSRTLAVCVPYYMRGAALYALRDEVTQRSKSTHRQLYEVRDPNSYGFWTYDRVMHWRAGSPAVKRSFRWGDEGYPKDASPVWVEEHYYNPGPCSSFADRGSWIPGLPADYTWLIHPQANVYMMNGGGGPPTVNESSSITEAKDVRDELLEVQLLDKVVRLHKQPDILYFLPSPTEFGNFFYRSACRIEAGKSEYANVGEPQNNDGQRHRVGFTRLADHKSAHHFIGVINE